MSAKQSYADAHKTVTAKGVGQVVKDVGQGLKQGWVDVDAIPQNSVYEYFDAKSNNLDDISIEHFEYVYPVIYGNGTTLLKTPMQLLIEAEHFESAEMLLKKGVQLPNYIRTSAFDDSRFDDYLRYLSQCSYDLFVEYHRLEALEIEASKETDTEGVTQETKMTGTDLLSMIKEKHANKLTGKLKKWVDGKSNV